MPSVTSVNDSAFYNCYDLTSISMPNVTSIGDGAFYNSAIPSDKRKDILRLSPKAFDDTNNDN